MSTLSDLHRFEKLYGLPAFVKQAEFETADDLQTLPSSAFADSIHRRFPCHTKSACFLSNLRFWEKAMVDGTTDYSTADRLLKLAAFWGIDDDLQTTLNTVKGGVVKEASDLKDENFALVVDWQGQKQRHYPVLNADFTKQAASAFYSERSNYPLSWRRQAAESLLQKVAEFEVELEPRIFEYLCKAAGQGVGDPTEVADALVTRAFYAAGSGLSKEAEKLRQIAGHLKDGIGVQPLGQLMDKTAEFIDELDRKTGLFHYYDRLPLPEEICNGVLVKTAAEDLDSKIVLVTGSVFSKEAIENSPAALTVLPDYEDMVRNGKVDIEKAADILPTIPRDEAMLLERALAAAGVTKTASYTERQVKLARYIKGDNSHADWSAWDKWGSSGLQRLSHGQQLLTPEEEMTRDNTSAKHPGWY